jgi:hypothetical protein
VTGVRLTLSHQTFRVMLVKVGITEKDLRELAEAEILRRARDSLTTWELQLFASELKSRKKEG